MHRTIYTLDLEQEVKKNEKEVRNTSQRTHICSKRKKSAQHLHGARASLIGIIWKVNSWHTMFIHY